MATKRKTKTVVKTKTVRKLRQKKAPKILSISAVAITSTGVSVCYGQGKDGRLYSWNGIKPAHWQLCEEEVSVQRNTFEEYRNSQMENALQETTQAAPLKCVSNGTPETAFE